MKTNIKFIIDHNKRTIKAFVNGIENPIDMSLNTVIKTCKERVSRRNKKLIESLKDAKTITENKSEHIIFTAPKALTRLKQEEIEWLKEYKEYGKYAAIAKICTYLKSYDYTLAKQYLNNAIKLSEYEDK